MINIKYEIYNNDYNRRYESKSFASMSDFKDWMFGMMHRPYVDDDGYKNMYFLDEVIRVGRDIRTGDEIRFKPEFRGAHYWIHCVNDNNNVVFSNGKYTNGQCYISEGFKAFMKECLDKRDGKVNDFVFGEIDGFEPAVEKTLDEQAAEIIATNPTLAQQIYSLLDKEHHRNDIVSQIAQHDSFVLSDISDDEIGALAYAFERAVSKNDAYFDAYWASADYVIDDFVTNKARSLCNNDVLYEIIKLADRELNNNGSIGYTMPDGKHHIYIYVDDSITLADDTKTVEDGFYVIEPNRVVNGAMEPMGNTATADYNNFMGLLEGCKWCLEVFEKDNVVSLADKLQAATAKSQEINSSEAVNFEIEKA